MMQSLGMSKSVVTSDSSKFYDCTRVTKQSTISGVHDPGVASQASSERRQLISLYSDILQLIKRNREPIPQPRNHITEAVASTTNAKEQPKDASQASVEETPSSLISASANEYETNIHHIEDAVDCTRPYSSRGESAPSYKSDSVPSVYNSNDNKKDHVIERTYSDPSFVSSDDGALLSDAELNPGADSSVHSELTDDCTSPTIDMYHNEAYLSDALHKDMTQRLSFDKGEDDEGDLPPGSPRRDLMGMDSASVCSSTTDSVSPPLSSHAGSDTNTTPSHNHSEAPLTSARSVSVETSRDSIGLDDASVNVRSDAEQSPVLSAASSILCEDDSLVMQGSLAATTNTQHITSIEPSISDTVDIGGSNTSNHSMFDEYDGLESSSSEDPSSRGDEISGQSPPESSISSVMSTPTISQSSAVIQHLEDEKDYSEDNSKSPGNSAPCYDRLGSYRDSFAPISEQRRQMRNDLLLLLESVPILKDLPKERLCGLLDYFRLQSYPPNAAIILAGERPQNFYVLASGMVSAYSYESFDKPNRLLRRYLNADYFGEISLMNNTPCSSYVISEGHATVQAMSGSDFVEQLSDLFPKFRQRAREEYISKINDTPIGSFTSNHATATEALQDIVDFIKRVPIVSMIPNLDRVVSKFERKEYSNKEVVVGSLKSLRDFCIVYRGSLAIHIDDPAFSMFSDFAILGPTAFIGSFEFTNPTVAKFMDSASLVAIGDVVLLKLDANTFNHHMKDIINHLCEYIGQFILDKMQEHELVQDVEDLSARLREGTSSELVSEEVASSSVDNSDDSSDGGFSPLDSAQLTSKCQSYQTTEMESPISNNGDDTHITDDGTHSDIISLAHCDEEPTSLLDPLEERQPVDSNYNDSATSCSINDNSHTGGGSFTVSKEGSLIDSGDHCDLSSLASNNLDIALKPYIEDDSISIKSSSFGSSASSSTFGSSEGDSVSLPLSKESLDTARTDTLDLPGSDASLPPYAGGPDRCENFENDQFQTFGIEVSTPDNDVDITETPRPIAVRKPTGIFETRIRASARVANGNRADACFVDDNASTTELTNNLHSDDERDSLSPNTDDDMSVSDDDSPELDMSDEYHDFYSDETGSATSRLYDEVSLRASKALLIATLKSKCTSLASAFSYMDSDNCGFVLRSRFYEAADDLCIASIEAGELPYLFDLLKEADRDVMTLASLYRNSGEHVKDATELCLRLKHVYGSALVAFEKQFGALKKSSTCTEADFTIMLNNVGVSDEEARSIFKELDVCGNGYVTVMTMLKLMRGDWSHEVALERETVSASSYNQILGYLQQEDYKEFRKEFSNPYMCVYDLLEYGTDIAAVDSSWEELKMPTKVSKAMQRYISKVIIPALEANEHFKMLSVIQRKYIASMFIESKYDSGSIIISEGQVDYPLYLLLRGKVVSYYSTYLYNEYGLADVAEGSWLGFDTFVQGQQSAYSYKVSEGAALLCSINSEAFKETVVPMIEARAKRVPVFSLFLNKLPCFENVDPADRERIARACVVRKYKMHETIFKANDPVEWLYILFDGCVILKMTGAHDQTCVSVETTGMLGAEEVAKNLTHYQKTAIANTPVLLLIGWPVAVFDDVFGNAAECIYEASQVDSATRDSMLQKLNSMNLASQSKNKKSVSFSINKDR